MEDEKIKILIIEDEWEYTDNIRDILEERGFYVEDSVTGEEALELMKNNDFDIVLIDIKLPDMSGIEILKKINEIAPNTISIMMTAFASIESSIEALTLGAFAYLYKPVNMDELLIHLRNAYHRRRMVMMNKRNADILDHFNLAVIATKSDGTVTYWNDGARKLFKWDFNEVFGNNIQLVFPSKTEDDRRLLADLLLEIPGCSNILNLVGKDNIKLRCCLKITRMKMLDENEGDIIWSFMGLDDARDLSDKNLKVVFSMPAGNVTAKR